MTRLTCLSCGVTLWDWYDPSQDRDHATYRCVDHPAVPGFPKSPHEFEFCLPCAAIIDANDAEALIRRSTSPPRGEAVVRRLAAYTGRLGSTTPYVVSLTETGRISVEVTAIHDSFMFNPSEESDVAARNVRQVGSRCLVTLTDHSEIALDLDEEFARFKALTPWRMPPWDEG